ncbi:uncharacterized protein EI90DRAFT_3032642 [Cantharellus anzutake]|uniref:uncharacterized protein n=1 Tax=Cantharellus anzutake TaxID=1750568 RepID=UPI0019059805|nr:uncharacterized protein EI90DRAFT_3032642 [Cantharellus anzutake]KAF8342256.1 hypothetical protein EI90DRAFT_3032642 [Cantharellus anzutake]
MIPQLDKLINLFPPLSLGLGIVIACQYSLTYEGSTTARLFRLALAPLGLYAFYDFCWRDFVEFDGALYPTNYVLVGTITTIGMVRLVDACLLTLLDSRPPHYIDHGTGNPIPLPTTPLRRLGYSLDMLYAMRGTSFYEGRHWNWASPKVATYRAAQAASPRLFALSSALSAFLSYLALDFTNSYLYFVISPILRTRSPGNHTPFTSLLPLWQQIICTFEFFFEIQVVYVISDTIPLVLCLGLGLCSDLDNWPPPFDNPLMSGSLPHFWSQAWHTTYRQFFLRFAHPFIYILFPSTRDSSAREADYSPSVDKSTTTQGGPQQNGIRSSAGLVLNNGTLNEKLDVHRNNGLSNHDKEPAGNKRRLSPAVAYVTMVLCFVASGLYHLSLMFRVRLASPPGSIPPPQPSLLQFWKYDISAAKFFLVQPIGITIDMILFRPILGKSSMIRRVFAWVWILYTIRWWLDAWAAAGMWDGEQPWLLGSPIRAVADRWGWVSGGA